jgi:hypothetical protein
LSAVCFTTAGNHLASHFAIWHTGQPRLPRIVQFHPGGTDNEISYTTVPGQTYAVEWKESLAGGLWSACTDDLAGDGMTNRVTHAAEVVLPARYYRVSTRIPPWDR